MAEDLITRGYLYNLVVERFELIEKFLVVKQNVNIIKNVFSDSARICNIVDELLRENIQFELSTFDNFYKRIRSLITFEGFREYLDSAIRKKTYDKLRGATNDSYNAFIVYILKEIAKYHNKLIEHNFNKFWHTRNEVRNFNNRPQTFLSYAYTDKGISLALYIYFLINGGFLYVNWMWSGTNFASVTKQELDDELSNSNQFLFLRTLNSELNYYGSSHIRQWCSWEIGNYYTKNKSQKFYLSFYGNTTNNDLLSTFNIFRYVRDGIINK